MNKFYSALGALLGASAITGALIPFDLPTVVIALISGVVTGLSYRFLRDGAV